MKKETQKTIDLLKDQLEDMIDVRKQYSFGEHLLSKYVQFDMEDNAKQYSNATCLKDYCKKSVRFLKEAGIKWATVEWDIVGEYLKEQPKADEWIEVKRQEALKWMDE